MTLVAWAVMPCHFIGGPIQTKSAKGFSGDIAAAHSELVALTSASATNINTVASFCYEEHILEKVRMSLEGPIKSSRRECQVWDHSRCIALLMDHRTRCLTVLVNRNQASFEDGIRSYQIFSFTVPSITELWTLIPTVISAISVMTLSFQTLDQKTEIEPDTPKESHPEIIRGDIEFQNVHFTYPSRPGVTIINNFSLQIQAGSKVALVGPSGAGKSSALPSVEILSL